MLTNILKFLEIVPTEITVALIGILSVAVSALLSMRISKMTTLAEISAEKEKREEIWNHEHETAYNEEFANMVTSITAYLSEQTKENYIRAVETVTPLKLRLQRRLALVMTL